MADTKDAKEEKTVIEITVPEGVKPGESLTVEGPYGKFEGPVPEGLKPGDKFQVEINPGESVDQTKLVTVTVPEDGKAGQVIKITGDLGTFEVEIPEGLKPGDKFNVKIDKPNHEPHVVEITVPEDAEPGKELLIDGPLGKFTVKIPEGLKAGEKFRIKIDEPNEEPQLVEVTVPEDAEPGTNLLIDGPLGKFQVEVPEGLTPGEKFRVRLEKPNPENTATPPVPPPAGDDEPPPLGEVQTQPKGKKKKNKKKKK